jgi:formylglycine-generating enzyme required for sulfatase activity
MRPRARRWIVVLGLLAGLCLPACLHAEAGDEASAPTEAALVHSLLNGAADEQEKAARALRRRGSACAAALRVAGTAADEAQRARIERLLGRLEGDWQRAQTPAGMAYVPAGAVEVPRAKAPWGPSGTRAQVSAFYIDIFEVSVADWRAYLAWQRAQGMEEGALRALWQPPAERAGRLPATEVRWAEAAQFARDYRGGRLPRAEEFERALRGSGVATWPWGAAAPKGRANLRDLGPGEVLPVGSFPQGASSFGVQDLVGNVAEWSATRIRQGRVGLYPLLLGGSYRDAAAPLLTWRGLDRMAARVGETERRPSVGFRVVRDVQPLP